MIIKNLVLEMVDFFINESNVFKAYETYVNICFNYTEAMISCHTFKEKQAHSQEFVKGEA